ncbi:MAG: FG-GAP repeat protein [Polyangiaceae bacterium]|nr:FG-GAP repeat protein [Polyangiaceae bacterium]
MTRRRHATLSALVLLGCSWSRFDEARDEAPVLILEQPPGMGDGFGRSMATSHIDDDTALFVVTEPGGQAAAEYRLGTGDDPSREATDLGHCAEKGAPCFLGSQVAALPRGPESTVGLTHCLLAGLGRHETSDGGHSVGVHTRCDAGAAQAEFTFALPTGELATAAEELIERGAGDPLALAASRAERPLVFAVWPRAHQAWFYPPGQTSAIVVPLPPEMERDLGGSAAVLAIDHRHLLVAAAKDGERLFLWRVDARYAVETIGCLGGDAELGRALTAGRVDFDAADDLVVSDAARVSVFSGAALVTVPATADPDCTLEALPPGALLASFGCGESAAVDGCSSSEFGASLAVGDLDGDGDGEVAVGAPRMRVRGERGAGAVLLYDVEPSAPNALAEVRYSSSASRDDGLGTAVSTPSIRNRQILAASAPGAGRIALFYCGSLGPADGSTPPCR